MDIEDYLDRDGYFNPDVDLPLKLGAQVDLYHAARELRLAMEKQVKEGVQKLEAALRENLISKLSKSDDTGVAGRRYRAQHKTKTVYRVDTSPEADGWRKIHDFIARHDRFDFLEKRLSAAAVADWYEANPDKRLPGVEKANISELSVTKI